MVAIITGTQPSGEATPYLTFMAENGIKRTRAFAILKLDVAPPTFMVGNLRCIDKGYGKAWFKALADGQITIDCDDLRAAAVLA